MAKKVTNDVMVVAAKATADKEVADTAVTKKVANDVTLMKGVMKETVGGVSRSRHHTNSGGGDQ
jgi:hypothetical protein